MLAHPVRERDVAREQLLGFAAAAQPLGLRRRVAVQQADGDAVEPVGGRRGDQLARRDRVAGQQQVAVAGQRALDDGLDAALAPRDVRRRGDRDDVAELDAVELVPSAASMAMRQVDLPTPLAPVSRRSTGRD